VGASINHRAKDRRSQHDDLRVYEFDSALEITGLCTYPEERLWESFFITVYGNQQDEGDLDARLREFHIEDKNGSPKYRKSGDRYLPLYKLPSGVGFLQKERGRNSWDGCAWVPNQTVSMMLSVLDRNGPVFAELHERRVGRNRWINGLTLQTTDPAYE
jgi:hypothetical protein